MPRERKHARRSIEDKPYVDNYPPLKEWLDKIEARCQWQLPYGDPEEPTAFMEQWCAKNGRPFIVVVFHNKNGWDIYTPNLSGRVDETLADAEARLGLAPVPTTPTENGGT